MSLAGANMEKDKYITKAGLVLLGEEAVIAKKKAEAESILREVKAIVKTVTKDRKVTEKTPKPMEKIPSKILQLKTPQSKSHGRGTQSDDKTTNYLAKGDNDMKFHEDFLRSGPAEEQEMSYNANTRKTPDRAGKPSKPPPGPRKERSNSDARSIRVEGIKETYSAEARVDVMKADMAPPQLEIAGIQSRYAAEASANVTPVEIKTLQAQMTGIDKEYTVEAKASVSNVKIESNNLKIQGLVDGAILRASLDINNACVKSGNVVMTGVDCQTRVEASASVAAADVNVGNVNLQGVSTSGVYADAELKFGVDAGNVKAGVDMSTGVSISTKPSFGNIDLTVGAPKLSVGPNFNFGIPIFGGSGKKGGDGGGKSKSMKRSKDTGGNGNGNGTTGSSHSGGGGGGGGPIGTGSAGGFGYQPGSVTGTTGGVSSPQNSGGLMKISSGNRTAENRTNGSSTNRESRSSTSSRHNGSSPAIGEGHNDPSRMSETMRGGSHNGPTTCSGQHVKGTQQSDGKADGVRSKHTSTTHTPLSTSTSKLAGAKFNVLPPITENRNRPNKNKEDETIEDFVRRGLSQEIAEKPNEGSSSTGDTSKEPLKFDRDAIRKRALKLCLTDGEYHQTKSASFSVSASTWAEVDQEMKQEEETEIQKPFGENKNIHTLKSLKMQSGKKVMKLGSGAIHGFID